MARRELPEPFRRRIDGRVVARWYDESGKRRQVTARTFETALDRRARWLAGFDDSESVGSFLDWWTGEFLPRRVAAGRLSEATRSIYERAAREQIQPRVGDTPLSTLSADRVQEMLDEAAADASAGGLSPQQVGVVHETMRVALETARRLELVERNAAALVAAPGRAAGSVR